MPTCAGRCRSQCGGPAGAVAELQYRGKGRACRRRSEGTTVPRRHTRPSLVSLTTAPAVHPSSKPLESAGRTLSSPLPPRRADPLLRLTPLRFASRRPPQSAPDVNPDSDGPFPARSSFLLLGRRAGRQRSNIDPYGIDLLSSFLSTTELCAYMYMNK